MLHVNFKAYGNYVTDSLYQWDINQELIISTLGLTVAPEIHFANANMDRAIVRQSTIDGGVITVKIPNSLLQEALTIKAYIGVYEGDTFKVIETIEIPVIPKKRPYDYTIEDTDEEIYSFKALERRMDEVLDDMRAEHDASIQEVKDMANNAKNDIGVMVSEYEDRVDSKVDEANNALEGVGVSNDFTCVNSKPGGLYLLDLVGNTEQNGEPSQDNPISIENTFDYVEMISGIWSTTNGAYTTNANRLCSKNHVSCKDGDVVKVITENSVTFSAVFFKSGGYVSSYSATTSGAENTFTIPSGVDSFKFNIGYTGITLETVGKITLTVNGKYVGQIVDLGRNELDYVDETSGCLDSTGAVAILSGWRYKIIEINSKYTYLLKGCSNGSTPKHVFYDENMKFISYMDDIKSTISLSITPPSNAKYFGVSYASANKNISVQKQKVTTFFLNEPLRATDRVVRMNGVWNENHKRATIVFSGTENWRRAGSDENKYFYFTEFNVAIEPSEIDKCTYFIRANITTNNTTVGFNNYITTSNDRRINVRPENVANMTVDDWKSWLAEQYANGTPFTLETVLTEETYTPLDTESQLALNSLETFDTVTYIEVDSKVKASGINAEYGIRKSGAYALKSLLNSESTAIKIDNVTSALLALSQG